MNNEQYNLKYGPIYAPDSEDSGVIDYTNPDKVKEVQKNLGVTVDGYLGPSTVSALSLSRRNQICTGPDSETPIVVGPNNYQVDSIPVQTYIENAKWGKTVSENRTKSVNQIVVHYDVSFNSDTTHKILKDRGLSCHFLIDGDQEATIYQCHDPATKVTYHAKGANQKSIGIEVNNPADTKFQDQDYNRRGRKRKVRADTVHGKKHKRLSYFPEQLESLRALIQVLCTVFDIPKKYPTDNNGNPIKTVIKDPTNFEGVVGHYHLTDRKTDPAPLEWQNLFKQ